MALQNIKRYRVLKGTRSEVWGLNKIICKVQNVWIQYNWNYKYVFECKVGLNLLKKNVSIYKLKFYFYLKHGCVRNDFFWMINTLL